MNVVCIGGGHGLAQMLQALKPIDAQITAIVATTDNGGSTGKIRSDYNCVAFGDIRRCILALAPENDLLKVLAEQRFENEGQLQGHCLGNLMLLGLNQMCHNPVDAITWMCHLFGVQQTILPMCIQAADLTATLESGKKVFGECNIDALGELPRTVALSTLVTAPSAAIAAILQADYIFIGPGSALTSVLPPLLVPQIQQALQNTLACRIFIENISPENSVAALQTKDSTEHWLSKLLGFKFNDLTITIDALNTLDTRLSGEQNSQDHLHDLGQLNHVLQQFLAPKLCSFKQSQNTTLH